MGEAFYDDDPSFFCLVFQSSSWLPGSSIAFLQKRKERIFLKDNDTESLCSNDADVESNISSTKKPQPKRRKNTICLLQLHYLKGNFEKTIYQNNNGNRSLTRYHR